MGVFDTVELYDGVELPEYPTALTLPEEVDWQTKEIGRPEMTTFQITAAGRLLEEEWHFEDLPPEDRPYASRDDVEEGDIRYIAGSLNRVHDGWTERSDYHGRFTIKSAFERRDAPLTYQVTFTHGHLEGFERIK